MPIDLNKHYAFAARSGSSVLQIKAMLGRGDVPQDALGNAARGLADLGNFEMPPEAKAQLVKLLLDAGLDLSSLSKKELGGLNLQRPDVRAAAKKILRRPRAESLVISLTHAAR
jgi:hypothetical protein